MCIRDSLQPEGLLILNTIERNKPAMIYLMDRTIGYYTDAAQITGNIMMLKPIFQLKGPLLRF